MTIYVVQVLAGQQPSRRTTMTQFDPVRLNRIECGYSKESWTHLYSSSVTDLSSLDAKVKLWKTHTVVEYFRVAFTATEALHKR